MIDSCKGRPVSLIFNQTCFDHSQLARPDACTCNICHQECGNAFLHRYPEMIYDVIHCIIKSMRQSMYVMPWEPKASMTGPNSSLCNNTFLGSKTYREYLTIQRCDAHRESSKQSVSDLEWINANHIHVENLGGNHVKKCERLVKIEKKILN